MMFSTKTVIIEGGDVLLPGREEGSLKSLTKLKKKKQKRYTPSGQGPQLYYLRGGTNEVNCSNLKKAFGLKLKQRHTTAHNVTPKNVRSEFPNHPLPYRHPYALNHRRFLIAWSKHLTTMKKSFTRGIGTML